MKFPKISQRISKLLCEQEKFKKRHNSVKKYRKGNGSCSCTSSDGVSYLNQVSLKYLLQFTCLPSLPKIPVEVTEQIRFSN